MSGEFRQWHAIGNPSAGKGRTKREIMDVCLFLQKNLPGIKITLTEFKEHAIQITERIIQEGCRHIIAIGGDGTNNEVINGILQQTSCPSREVTYALFPFGTGNDWIRTWGIPKKMDDWLELFLKESTRFQDIGKVSYQNNSQTKTRYFANVAGMAYDGFLIHYVQNKEYLKRNNLTYLYLILKCLFKYKLKKAIVKFDGKEKEGFFYTINAGVCRYSGGGMQVVPHADPTDGYFALTTAGKLSKLGVIINTWRFYNGSIGKHPKVDTIFAKEIEVRGSNGQEILLEVDGEFLGESPSKFEIIPGALKIIAPLDY